MEEGGKAETKKEMQWEMHASESNSIWRFISAECFEYGARSSLRWLDPAYCILHTALIVFTYLLVLKRADPRPVPFGAVWETSPRCLLGKWACVQGRGYNGKNI